MTKSGAWWLTICLDLNEFTLNNLAVDCHRLEVSQFIHKFSITLLSSEIVNTILNCITFALLKLILLVQVSGRDDCARATLNHWQHSLGTWFQLQFHPFKRIHMEHNHVLRNHSILSLTAVDDHASLVCGRRVVLPGSNADTFSLDHIDSAGLQVVL